MKRLILALACCAPTFALAADPPKAAVALYGPAVGVATDLPLILDATGSISDYPVEWTVTPQVPVVTFDQATRQSVLAIIPPPLASDTTYVVTIQALGLTPEGKPVGRVASFVFTTKSAEPVIVNPPRPPVVVDPQPVDPAAVDRFGLKAWCRQNINSLSWSIDQIKFRQEKLVPAFDAASKTAGAAPDLQSAVVASSKGLKDSLGSVGYSQWKPTVIQPIVGQLQVLQRDGKLASPADLAAALSDVSTTLMEGYRR